MTDVEAVDLVFDLISAVRDYEERKDKYYRAQYEEARQRVIDALVSPSHSEPSSYKGII